MTRRKQRQNQQTTHVDLRNQHVETQYIAAGNIHVTALASNASILEKRNRQIMLDRVKHIWITGFLDKSLHLESPIVLKLHSQPNAIENLLYPLLQELDLNGKILPTTTSIVEAYENANKALLILGGPGSGKTTLLLELTNHLLEQAKQDDIHLIPVVFNLSSWSLKQQPLQEWIIEELITRYQVPREVSQSWVENNQLLPLLDGLDEVSQKNRSACIDVINAYRKDHGLTSIVICCRLTEYESLIKKKQKLRLLGAVIIQPLTFQKIDEYLSQRGEQFALLRLSLIHI